jgi:hypothetical protein
MCRLCGGEFGAHPLKVVVLWRGNGNGWRAKCLRGVSGEVQEDNSDRGVFAGLSLGRREAHWLYFAGSCAA